MRQSQRDEQSGRREIEAEAEKRWSDQRARRVKQDIGCIGAGQRRAGITAGEAGKADGVKATDDAAPGKEQDDIGDIGCLRGERQNQRAERAEAADEHQQPGATELVGRETRRNLQKRIAERENGGGDGGGTRAPAMTQRKDREQAESGRLDRAVEKGSRCRRGGIAQNTEERQRLCFLQHRGIGACEADRQYSGKGK